MSNSSGSLKYLKLVARLHISDINFFSQEDATNIDKKLFNDYGFSVDQLMELAGLSCATSIATVYPKSQLAKNGRVLVICGPGNNGGDGFVCARHLHMFVRFVLIKFLSQKEENFIFQGYKMQFLYPKPSNKDLMKRLVTQMHGMQIKDIEVVPNSNFMNDNYDLIVDAIFGFSFKPPLREPFGRIISELRNVTIPVASIDIPSGWDVEQGPIDDESLNPDLLISLTAPKLCAKYFKGRHHFLGGRFVPKTLADMYELNLPDYPSTECILRLE
uniref:NAD(P)H-hydrate epimerase n=1 Tax=Romanomermis culicivorax TaxID=13658 RepID=A0A915KDL8_ROMCU